MCERTQTSHSDATAHLATALALLHRLSSKWHTSLWSTSSGSWLCLHSGLDLTSHCEEGLFDVGGSLCRSFEEFNAKAVSKLLSLFSGDYTLSSQIGLVTHEELVDILRSISVNFMQPLFHIVERLLVSDVVDDNDSMGTTVIRRSNGTEALLSGSIPDLQLDSLAVKFNCADFLH